MTQHAVRCDPISARDKVLAGLLTTSLFLAATLAAGVVFAAEFGDRDRGSRVAARWCANCHVVSPDADRAPKDAIPTFIAIAARPSTNDTNLNTVLTAPHGPMPTDVLSRQDRADVIAYILSFKPS